MSNAVQVADILEVMLDYAGESAVRMSSFSISEEFLRRLYFIRKSKKISDIEITLDFKATQKTMILWPFIRQTVEKCFLADNHSKILIVVGKTKAAAAIMSQNLTRGNRYECGAITTDGHLIQDILSQYQNVVKNFSIPFRDVYRRTTQRD